MKTATLFLALALGVAAYVAPSLDKRDGFIVKRVFASVTSVIDSVETGILNLDSAVKAFTSNDAAVQSASSELVTTINDGTTIVEAQAELSLENALSLINVVSKLQSDASTLASDLEAKKTAFASATLCAVAAAQIASVETASNALITAIVDIVPAIGQGAAKAQGSSLQSILAAAETAFSPANCVNA